MNQINNLTQKKKNSVLFHVALVVWVEGLNPSVRVVPDSLR